MLPLIVNIARLTKHTFPKNVNNDSLDKLRSLVSCLKACDVDFHCERIENSQLIAPVVHINLHEESSYSLGIFAIKQGNKIPLHNHPQMHGIIKVIKGKVKIKSYSLLSPNKSYNIPKEILSLISSKKAHLIVPTIAKQEKVLSYEDQATCFLTPIEDNIHEIVSLEGLSAFFDILAPSYEDAKCQFYSLLGTTYEPTNDINISWLMRIDPPSYYWCQSYPYTGPPICKYF